MSQPTMTAAARRMALVATMVAAISRTIDRRALSRTDTERARDMVDHEQSVVGDRPTPAIS